MAARTFAETDFADLIAASPAAGFLSKSDLSASAISMILESANGLEPAQPAEV